MKDYEEQIKNILRPYLKKFKEVLHAEILTEFLEQAEERRNSEGATHEDAMSYLEAPYNGVEINEWVCSIAGKVMANDVIKQLQEADAKFGVGTEGKGVLSILNGNEVTECTK